MFELNKTPKRVLPGWIWKQLSEVGEFTSVYDAFCGNGAVVSYFKKRGALIYASDILQCNYWLNRALIQNTQNE